MFTTPIVKGKRRQTAMGVRSRLNESNASLDTGNDSTRNSTFQVASNSSLSRKSMVQSTEGIEQKITEAQRQSIAEDTASHKREQHSPFKPSSASKTKRLQNDSAARPIWHSSTEKRPKKLRLTESSQSLLPGTPWEVVAESEQTDEEDSKDDVLIEAFENTSSTVLAPGPHSMDDDDHSGHGEGARVLLRGDKHAVFEVSEYPDVVRKYIGSIDFASVPVSSGLSTNDDRSGFAYVATPSACYVWAYTSDSGNGGTGSVYRLDMPDPSDASVYEAPLVEFVALGGGLHNDVGVLACTATGQLRYWERVVFGLAGTDRFYSADLNIGEDRCSQLIEIYSGLYVVATAKGRLFHVSLQNTQGQPELIVRMIGSKGNGRAGMLSRMSSFLSSNKAEIEPGDAVVGISAGARTEIRHSRELFVLTRERLLKWVVSRAHADKFLYTTPVLSAISRVASNEINFDAAVTLLDVSATTRDGRICVLVGLQVPSRVGEMQIGVAFLKSLQVSVEPEVEALRPLNFFVPEESVAQEGAARPRLVVPDGGPGMFVVLPKAVVATVSMTSATVFEEHIEFREADRVLGFTASLEFPYPHHAANEARIVLACRNAGVIEMVAEVGSIISATAKPPSTTENNDITVLQSQLEQAVFFSDAHNPLSFSLSSTQPPGTIDAALQSAVVRVSNSIINNTSRFIAQDRLDLSAQLRERLRRIHTIIQFIDESQLTDRLSLSTRMRLSENAEKLAAAVALWGYQNSVWHAHDNMAATQLLKNLVSAYLETVGLHDIDPLRVFFRSYVASVGDLLGIMHTNLGSLCRALMATNESGVRDSQMVVYEANRIIVSALQAALSYRFQNRELYKIEGGSSERWTESPVILDLLVERLESSYQLCREVSGQYCAPVFERIRDTMLPGDCADPNDKQGRRLTVFDDEVSVSFERQKTGGMNGNDDVAIRMQQEQSDNPYISALALLREAVDQIGPLANICFRIFVDKSAQIALANPSNAQSITERYDTIRPRFILALVPLGRAAVAFRLAEEYRDLDALVTLVFSASSESIADNLRSYVDRFGRDFAMSLFAFYERRRAWASLLYAHDGELDQWLKEYLDSSTHGPIVQIGWIHDAKVGDLSSAATSLTRAGLESGEIDQARTMLSLSKLALIALETQDSTDDPVLGEAHTRLEDALDMCNVQDQILHYYSELMESHNNGASWQHCNDSDDRKAVLDIAMLTTTPEFRHSLPAFYIIYSEFVRGIWNHRTTNVEDLLDILTLPDNITSSDPVMDDRMSLAVDILSRASFLNLPEQSRESALRTVWRRIFITDDWEGINKMLGVCDVTDSAVRETLCGTRLYGVLCACLRERELDFESWFLQPYDAFADQDLSYFAGRLSSRFADAGSINHTTTAAIRADYETEDQRLRMAINSGVAKYCREILKFVEEADKLDDDVEEDVQMDSD